MIKTLLKKIISDKAYERLWDFYFALLARFYALFPIDKKKIFITSYYGNDYGDNGKYIVEALKKRNAGCEIVWQLKEPLLKNNRLPANVRAVKYRSRQAVYEMETSAVWIDNARKTYGIKRKGQLYIQTWHGGPGVKRIEKDVARELGPQYVKTAKKDSKMCDVILSNSDFMTDIYTRAFWYDGTIAKTGTPRNDILCKEHPEIKKKVNGFYRIPDDTKLVLYAPTFRSDKSIDKYNIDFNRLRETLKTKFGGEWAVLMRLHPNISDRASELSCDGIRVINATLYPDMQELLSASDCLITDYSSSDIDYLLTRRPCFLYACDIEAYSGDRGYYFRWDELPFSISRDNDVLSQNILAFNDAAYQKEIDAFHQKTGVFDKGTASDAAADIILKHIG